MKAFIALAGLALAAPAFAQSPVKAAAACCPCGGGCQCPVGACPDCLVPIQSFLPVPGSAKLAPQACPGGVCPTGGCPATAPVASFAGASHSAAFFVTGGGAHPLAARVGAPLARLRGFVAAHRLFGRGCR